MSVGSTNFDSRSFSVNDEANLNVYDRRFAAAQARIFEEDLQRSKRISLATLSGGSEKEVFLTYRFMKTG